MTADCNLLANQFNSTLVELLGHRAETQFNQVAYTFIQQGEEVGKLTYGELEQQARAIAAYLQSRQSFGERALLLYPPGLDFIAAFFGCLYAGAIAVPAYPPRPNQKLSRLQAIMADAQATIALTTQSLLTSIERQLVQSPDLAAMHWIATDDLTSIGQDWKAPQVSPETLAFLQYTSGSTGTPKGVMVSHGNLLHNSALIQQVYENTVDTRGASWLPPYHDMGLIGGILQPLYVGATTVLMSPMDFLQKPLRWLQAISRYQATTSGGPNFAYDYCTRKITPEQRDRLDLSSWEVAFTGAEPIHAQTLERFAATFAECGFRREAFLPCYGMAEATLMVSGGSKSIPPKICDVVGASLEQNRVVTATNKSEATRTVVGCGQNVGQKIIIVDPEALTECPADGVGEIWVSGSSIAQGYWQQPEATQQDFHAYLASGSEPFLRTGDLGFLQDGELFVTGRIKDVIIIRGQNHYPQDIERTVQNSHLALRPYCGAAFAVEVKGSERVVIVQEVERSYLRKLDVKAVVDSIRQAVSAHHDLKVYATVLIKTGSIPKTSSGKVQRYACRQGFLAGTLNVVEDWSEHPHGKAKFLQLQAEVDSMFEKLTASKR